MRYKLVYLFVAGYLCFLAPSVADAQQQSAPAADDSETLAKKLSNPISDLVSVPFQFNWQQNVGPLDLSQFILNVQPVIPFTLTEHWNLIARIITPFIGQPPLFTGDPSAFGVGDLTTSFFLSPSTPRHGITIGAGPVFVTPASYEPTIGSGKFSAGPTVVVLRQEGKLTYGVLWNQVWSFAGDRRREDVDAMFLQPFLSFQYTKTITLTVQSESAANWEVDTDRWTVPINLLIAKLSSFGTFPASYQLGYGYYAAHPDMGPTWKIRAAIVILLPRKK